MTPCKWFIWANDDRTDSVLVPGYTTLRGPAVCEGARRLERPEGECRAVCVGTKAESHYGAAAYGF